MNEITKRIAENLLIARVRKRRRSSCGPPNFFEPNKKPPAETEGCFYGGVP